MVFDDDIISAKKCPYCGSIPEFVDSQRIYNKSYGMIYLCQPCGAYVGTHKGTNKSLRRLANEPLRRWKRVAHRYFGPLWKRKQVILQQRGYNEREAKHIARSSAYNWLSGELGIQNEYCHIGMFDEGLCKKVIEICKPYYSIK